MQIQQAEMTQKTSKGISTELLLATLKYMAVIVRQYGFRFGNGEVIYATSD